MLIVRSERCWILMPNNEPGAEVELNCCAGSACLKDNSFYATLIIIWIINWIYETLLKSHKDICAFNMDFCNISHVIVVIIHIVQFASWANKTLSWFGNRLVFMGALFKKATLLGSQFKEELCHFGSTGVTKWNHKKNDFSNRFSYLSIKKISPPITHAISWTSVGFVDLIKNSHF